MLAEVVSLRGCHLVRFFELGVWFWGLGSIGKRWPVHGCVGLSFLGHHGVGFLLVGGFGSLVFRVCFLGFLVVFVVWFIFLGFVGESVEFL